MRRDSLLQLPRPLAQEGSRAPGRYLMAIDGGATKTLAAVLDLQEHLVHLAEGGPSNADAVGSKSAGEALLAVAADAIERAGIEEHQLAMAVLTVAGTDTDAIARYVQTQRSADWIVVNDVVGAWATATQAQPGVGAISGTGSNVFGVGPDWRTWRAGGWGHLLGDEGSGYWLGVRSIHAALSDRDGSGPETALSDAAVEFFDVASVEALAALVYSKPLTNSQIASFAAETSRLANAGDQVACALFTHGARELARQILTVVAETGLGADGDAFPVGLIGSVYKAGAVFIDPLVAAVQEQAPSARVATVEMPPVGGGLQLAVRACGCAEQIGADELARLFTGAVIG